jgi:AAA family ATP:ADP antiporter
MPNFLTDTLKIKSEEQRQIILMLGMGFFMGVFLSTYQVTADSLFLNRLGDSLDKAFLVAGTLGIITTALFAFFQNRVRFTSLALISVTLTLIFTISAYWLLHYGDVKWHDEFIFALYCMTGPITAVLLLSFWGIFGRLFNFRQSKSIIGWIDTGQLIACIITTLFAIPFTSEIVQDTSNYLIVCAISILLVFLIMLFISTSFTLSKNDPREFGTSVIRETRLHKILGDGYTRILSVFLMVSMLMFVLSQYSFQEIVREQYPEERALTTFNSFFLGAVYGISLIMQTFVNNRIISNYGLRVTLILLPVVTIIFAAGSILSGTVFGYQKELAPAGFIYFFLFVALTRLFNWILRESLENPVFKLFFIPLDNRTRFSIQSKVEGMMNESARFIGGLVIFGLAFVPFFNIMYISGAMIVLSIAYFVVVNKMYSGYRNKIRMKLESSDIQLERLEKGQSEVMSRLEMMLNERDESKAIFSFKLLEKINAANVPLWINYLMKNEDEKIRQYAQNKMNEVNGLSVSDKYVIRLDQSKVNDYLNKNVLNRADLQSFIENSGDITKGRIQKLARSENPEDRHYAAELMLHTTTDEFNSFLAELLFDPEGKVRNTAIKTATKKYNSEIIHGIIENLKSPVYSNQAMNALVMIGTETLPALESTFYRIGQSTQMMLRIVQVIGRIGGQRAREILWGKMDYPNKVIVSQVLLSLGECGFKAGISQITRIKYVIESDIDDISWNLSAIQEISPGIFCEEIKQALRWEVQNDVEHIYMLLTMLYDTRSIQLVKENIDSKTTEGITYAIELLDVFLSEQLKQRVIPVLDDISDAERISRLHDFYPRVKLDHKLVLKFLINRDFTQSNRWTKACVLYHIGEQRYTEFVIDLIAQLFNPDALIREVSADALYKINPSQYHEHVARLGEVAKRALDAVVVEKSRTSLFERILFFSKLDAFEGITGLVLSHLGDISNELRLQEGEVIQIDSRTNNQFFVILKGEVDFIQRGEHAGKFIEGQFIGEMLGSNDFVNTNILIAKTEVIMLKFNKDQFYELLSDNISLADKILVFI